MEILSHKKRDSLLVFALSAIAFSGCSIDSYLTNSADVQCDGKRTVADLSNNGLATFIVHGKQKGDLATIKVRRSEEGASVGVSGDVTDPPQQLEADGFTKPIPVVDGAELSTFGAGGAWVIDVRKDSVVILGACDGM